MADPTISEKMKDLNKTLTRKEASAASDVYKRQNNLIAFSVIFEMLLISVIKKLPTFGRKLKNWNRRILS